MFTREEICNVLKEFRDTGVTVYKHKKFWYVTHTLGDGHAKKIVDGKIELSVALEDEQHRQKYIREMRQR